MIRQTSEAALASRDILSAYKDNATVSLQADFLSLFRPRPHLWLSKESAAFNT